MANTFNTKFTSKTQYTLDIETIRGVDLANTPLFVDKSRATEQLNFEMKNGVLTKRDGWEEEIDFSSYLTHKSHEMTGSDEKVNGFTKTTINSTEYYIFTTNAGYVYYSTNINGTFTKANELSSDALPYDVVGIGRLWDSNNYSSNPVKPFFFNANGKVYTLLQCWNTKGLAEISYDTSTQKLVLKNVGFSKSTYIPTTTISIPATSETSYTSQAYEDVNLMTPYRKNTLIGKNGEATYILDGKIPSSQYDNVYVTNSVDGATLDYGNEDYTFGTSDNGEYTTITLNGNFAPSITGQANITVEFSINGSGYWYNANYFDSFTGSFKDTQQFDSVATMFGYNGNNSDLWVANGNQLYHSKNGNLTYFSPYDIITLGSSDNPITGLQVLEDNTLLVTKGNSVKEPTAYIITASMVTATNYAGETIDGAVEEIYSVAATNFDKGTNNKQALFSINGYNLMLTDSGVYRVYIGETSSTTTRYQKPCSRLINDRLLKDYTKEEINNAKIIAYKDKYYMAFNNGKVYVLDTRYPFQLSDDLASEYEFEAFVFDNIDVNSWLILDDNLYFINSKNRLCKFVKDTYSDVSYATISLGQMTYDTENECFVIDSTGSYDLVSLKDNDNFKLTNSNAIKCTFWYKGTNGFTTNTSSRKIYVPKTLYSLDEIQMLCTYKANFKNSTVDYDLMLSIEDIEEEKIVVAFRELLVDDDGNYYCGDVKNNLYFTNYNNYTYEMPKETIITNVKAYDSVAEEFVEYDDLIYDNINQQYYKYDSDGTLIRIYDKNELTFNYFNLAVSKNSNGYHKPKTGQTYVGKITLNNPVCCYYLTPIFNLGSVVYAKTIKSLVIVPDTLLNTEVVFGYETKKNTKEFSVYTGRKLDFNNLDFDDITFDSENFAKAYVKKVKERNVNFIRFFFQNNTNTNCKISNMTITYEYGRKNKGVA